MALLSGLSHLGHSEAILNSSKEEMLRSILAARRAEYVVRLLVFLRLLPEKRHQLAVKLFIGKDRSLHTS